MLCLTVRQPWAWCIFHGGKTIENRNWTTKVRGRVAIHAAKGLTTDEYLEAAEFIRNVARAYGKRIAVPAMYELPRGVVLGTTELTDCISSSGSPWFMGRYGLVLHESRLLPTPIPAKGALGFWNWEVSA